MKKNKNLKKFYDKVYKKGERRHFTTLATTGSVTEETNEVLRELSWKSKKVLDVGCGTGFFAYNAAKKGADVLGIDFSEEAIDIAQKKYSHPNLRYEHMDVNKINDAELINEYLILATKYGIFVYNLEQELQK